MLNAVSSNYHLRNIQYSNLISDFLTELGWKFFWSYKMFAFLPPFSPHFEERDAEKNTHEVECGMITSFTTEPQHNELFSPLYLMLHFSLARAIKQFYSLFTLCFHPEVQCLWTLPPNLPVPHPWEIRLRLLEIVHVAGRWYWFCYAPFLFICPLVYEPFIEWTVSFHISMLWSGMLWIQDSSELPVSPGWTAWRWSAVNAPHPTSCLQRAKG